MFLVGMEQVLQLQHPKSKLRKVTTNLRVAQNLVVVQQKVKFQSEEIKNNYKDANLKRKG